MVVGKSREAQVCRYIARSGDDIGLARVKQDWQHNRKHRDILGRGDNVDMSASRLLLPTRAVDMLTPTLTFADVRCSPGHRVQEEVQ